MAVFDGKLHPDAGNTNNLKNGFVHEGVHKKDGKSGPGAELNAIHAQTSHPSWKSTTESYMIGIKVYTVKNTNTYLNENPAVPESNVPYLNFINGNFTGTGVVIYNREATIGYPDFDAVGKK